MAWNDPSETIVAGTGEVYVGAVGSTQPTTPTATPAVAFTGLGYHTEDGVSLNKALEVNEFRVWQSLQPVRRERESEDFTITFVLVQWNESTLPLAFGGGLVTNPSGSIYRYDPPDLDDALDERALIVDVQDGSKHGRIIIPRGTVSEGVESTFRRNEMAGLSVSFKALVPADGSSSWYFLTDDAASFAVGS